MDYSELAADLLNVMQLHRKAKPQRNIDESMHGEIFVLKYIADHNGGVLPGEIGQEMNVSSARIAAALNSLEKKGLITRRIDTSDRRKILVGITQAGKEQAQEHYQTVLGVTAKMLELLGEHDAKEYVRIMKKMAEMLPAFKEFV